MTIGVVSLKKILPVPALSLLWIMRSRNRRKRSDLLACISFMFNRKLNTSFRNRLRILNQLYVITFAVDSPHTQEEILMYIEKILWLPAGGRGVVVEAGCYKGSSRAKFSLVADIAYRELVIFHCFG